jgi:membrane protein YqaA with SNARE-associated domain
MINSVYLEILKDSFWGNFAPTVNGEFAYIIVLYFGKHDNILASLYALAGSVGGLTATYFLFYGLALLLKKILNRNPNYPQSRHYISKLSPIFGIITVIPQICVIPAFFFGMAKLDFKKFILITIFYRVAYYIFMLSTTQPLYS